MTERDLDRLLADCVLDPGVRGRLERDMAGVCREYGLDPQATSAVLGAEERLRAAVSAACRRLVDDRRAVLPAAPDDAPPPDAPPASVAGLTPSRLALRLVPYVQRTSGAPDEPPVVVNYVGHLDPLPAGASPADLPAVPVAALPGRALPPLTLVVEIQPVLQTEAGGEAAVSFRVHSEPAPAPADDGRTAASLSPWPHDTRSPAVLAAAEAARNAPPAERYARLLCLIDRMTGAARGGEPPS